MITTILSDFSRVILNLKDTTYRGTLNSLYKSLIEKGEPFNFYDYYVFNDELLGYYNKLKDHYGLYILTTGSIQKKAPEVDQKIKGIFKGILTTQSYPVNKLDSSLYEIIAKELNKSEDEMLLIDDSEENTKAARQAGLHAILYTDNRNLFIQLERLL